MPILHSQIAAQGKTPDGKLVPIAPAQALVMRGPILQVSVTIEQNVAKALLTQGGKTVPTKAGIALIDTGASNTCIDDKAAQELGLPVIDVGSMQSASHEKHPCIYPVQIITPVVTLNSARTMGANLASQGLLVLIGRDVLASCNLFYNGPSGQFTLSL